MILVVGESSCEKNLHDSLFPSWRILEERKDSLFLNVKRLRESDERLKDIENSQSLIDGLRIYYNFIRLHQSLNGKTPPEVYEIDLNLGKKK